MRQQLGRVVAVVACALVVTLIMLGVPEAFAQQRGQPSFGGGYGDMNSLAAGFRFILRIAVIAVPILLMAYYTWKMRPKDRGRLGGARLVRHRLHPRDHLSPRIERAAPDQLWKLRGTALLQVGYGGRLPAPYAQGG